MVTKNPLLKVVGTAADLNRPPRQLGEHGLKLWEAITAEYRVDDAGGREILAQCCAALDRAEALRGQIDADGEVLHVRGGVKSHPAIRDELACRAFITRAIGRLGLDVEAIRPMGRPAKGY